MMLSGRFCGAVRRLALVAMVVAWAGGMAGGDEPASSAEKTSRPRARDLGIRIGVLPTGELNAITDVAGVRVGHRSLIAGDSVRTGVTAVLPHGGNVFQNKTPAALYVANGFGKFVGATQIQELGVIETPIVLTNTLSTFAAADALVAWSLRQQGNEDVRSVNPVVGECNDGYLNDIRGQHVRADDVLAALNDAKTGAVAEGCVGAGVGTRCLGWKGGIGTSSRKLPAALGGYTVGVLVQTNFDGLLTIAGAPVGRELGRYYLKDVVGGQEHGSCIVIVATDAPLDARQLERLAKRAVLGLAAVGSPITHGSGDYVLAFSTSEILRQRFTSNRSVETVTVLRDDRLSPLFQAVREATEEAVINSMLKATTTVGREGHRVEAMEPSDVVRVCRKFGVVAGAGGSSGRFVFRHHFIDRDLPGTSYGQTCLVDMDKDGDLDFVTGGKDERKSVFWFEYRGADDWLRHTIGVNHPSDVGGMALDVDGDGWLDHVTGGVWYRNRGQPREEPFERIVFDADLAAVHDLVPADLDGDGRMEIVTMSDKNNLRWYRIPRQPRERWERHDVGAGVHAGVAVGDLDGDGDADIARSNAWFENSDGKGLRWAEHAVPFGNPNPPYPLATRCRIVDVNRDGHNDLVMTENEIRSGKIAWLENRGGKGLDFVVHELAAGDAAARGAYHSLAVADFDQDGDEDVFTVEMEAIAGARPPRWLIWENVDGRGSDFRERVIVDNGLGGHEAVVGDVDGDGDLDICSKLWRPRRDNANGGRNHADFVENLLK